MQGFQAPITMMRSKELLFMKEAYTSQMESVIVGLFLFKLPELIPSSDFLDIHY